MQVVERLKTERRKKRSKWVREWLRYRSLHGEYNQLNEYLRSKKKKKSAPINRRCTDLHCRRARTYTADVHEGFSAATASPLKYNMFARLLQHVSTHMVQHYN